MTSNEYIYQENRLSLFVKYKKVEEHKHFAKHILLSDKPFICVIDNKEYELSSAFIQSNTTHLVEYDENQLMFMMLIDESSLLSSKIDKLYLKNRNFLEIPEFIYKGARKFLSYENLEELDKFLVDNLCDLSVTGSMDKRIKEVLFYIDRLETLYNNLFGDMARKSYLSESRFSHLFKTEVGIDFKNYVLIKKFANTFSYVLLENMSITSACIKAGFSSSSHFASAYKSHFGLSLSDFVKSQNYK